MNEREYLLSITHSSNGDTINVLNEIDDADVERIYDYCLKMKQAHYDKVFIDEVLLNNDNYFSVTIKAKALFGR